MVVPRVEKMECLFYFVTSCVAQRYNSDTMLTFVVFFFVDLIGFVLWD